MLLYITIPLYISTDAHTHFSGFNDWNLFAVEQTYMQLATTRSKEQRKLMKMERKRGPEITSWLYNNGVPLNMKKMIMTCVLRELEANQDVNIENILSILPLESLKFIKRHLCLDTLKKVR